MSTQFLTMKYHLKVNELEKSLLDFLCHISKNIYNYTLYRLRDIYFNNEDFPTYFDTNKLIKENDNYHILNTYMSICTIRNVHSNMSKFMRRNKDKRCQIPNYLRKEGYYPLISDQIRIIEHNNKKCIKLPLSNIVRTKRILKEEYNDSLLNTFIDKLNEESIQDIYIYIPKELYKKEIRQIRIIPKYNACYYEVELTYINDEKERINNNTKEASIDLGINNLATCVIKDNTSFIIDGKCLKSKNRIFNKNMAYFQSKNNDRTYQTKRMKSMRIKHSNYVKDYINKAGMELINLLRLSDVKKVIVGYNKGLKKEGIHNPLLTNKQKAKVNQSFVRIPLLKFKNRIKYLCEKYNLIYEEVNESYTSMKSFYDNDELNKESLTSGKRIKRGLYETKDKRIINSDVNGALNIYKKSKPINDKSVLSLMDRGLTVPFRVKVFM